jgi:hypothetical protein
MYTAKVAVCFEIRTKHSKQSPLYKESVRTALSTLSTTVIKTSQLKMYRAKVAVCFEIRTKHSKQSALYKESFRTAL